MGGCPIRQRVDASDGWSGSSPPPGSFSISCISRLVVNGSCLPSRLSRVRIPPGAPISSMHHVRNGTTALGKNVRGRASMMLHVSISQPGQRTALPWRLYGFKSRWGLQFQLSVAVHMAALSRKHCMLDGFHARCLGSTQATNRMG